MDDSMMMTDLAAKQRPWYEQPMKLSDIRSCISASFQSMKREYVAIGYYLKRAEQEALYLEDGYSSIWEFAQEEYGLSKSSASRYMSINTKFSVDGNSPILQEQYKAYSKSQLQEMLYLEDEKLEQVNPEMRVQDIREMRQPKEKAYNIPYFELEGQLNIEKDFPEYLPDVMTVRPEADATLPSSSFTMDISDMFPTLEAEESVAISQQQDEQMISAPAQETEKVEEREAYVHEQFRLQEEYLYPFAKRVIRENKGWFMEDYMGRVINVNTSEPLLKELLGANDEGRQYNIDLEDKTVVLCLFKDRIDVHYFDSSEMLHTDGACEWFYFAAAVQAMWDEVTFKDARERAIGEKLVGAVEKEESDEAGSVAISQQESQAENILPAEGYSIGSLPQVKESLLYQLAQILVEKRGQMIRAKSFGSIPSDDVITEEIRTLTRQADGEVGLKDGAGAYASAEIIEFFRGGEDLGVCTYARFATQARKAFSEWETREKLAAETVEEKPAVIDAEFTEVDDPQDKDMTDLEIARKELERANNLLIKCLSDLPDENNIYIRGMKLKVAALASLVCDLDDIENPPPKPEQPELPLLKNNDQRAAFVDAYETWPLWIETNETGERYYRYDLTDGTSMVVKVYHARLFAYGKTDLPWEERYTEGYGRHEYYLLKPDKFFRNCEANRSALIEKLKEIQKKG